MAVVKNLMVRSGADFSQLYKEMNKSQRKLSAWQQTINKTLKGVGAILGGVTIGAAIKSTIQSASELESAMLGLQSILEAQGRSFTHANQFIQEYISDGLVPLTDAVTAYKNLTARGYNDEQIKQVMLRLKDAASFGRQSSYTLGEAVRSATEGLKNENSVLVDNAGVTKNVAKMWDEYARSIGKSRNELTQQEKIQAEVSGIMKETQFQVGDAAKYTKTYAGRLAMLSKTLQDIKITIGNALKPGAGAGLEGLIEQFSAMKSWAEANQATIQRWGQGIANAIKVVIKGFKLITGAIVENWQAIKFVGTTLLTYVAITKGAAAATTAWRIATLTLKGELMTKIPLLTAVSTAIGTYRLQMALAPATTNLFTGALLRLRVALYAVHTALGPIGWAILAISAAVSGGMALWNKYNQSLQKTASLGFGDFRTAQDGLAKSTGKAAEASEDQADAIEKAGKAAKKSLAGFDEIHQLQKDMAEGGGAGEDILDEFDLGGIGGGIPGLDMGDMLCEIEQMKPTLKGFWEWIKQGAGNLWDGVKVKWQVFKDWVANSWAGQLWQGIKDKWGGFKGWAGNLWDGIKEKWGGFTDWVGEKWSKFKDKSGQIWDGVKTNVQKSWESLKTNAPVVWNNIKTIIETSWNTLSTGAKKTWASIKDTIQSNWDILKKEAPAAWDNIKTAISTKANEARDALKRAWDEITKKTNETWTSIKANSGTAWNNIKTSLSQTWSSIQSNAGNTLANMRNTISNAWNNIRSTTQTVWNNIKNAITSPIESAKQTVLNIIDRIKSAFANMRIEIPRPRLPEIKVSWREVGVGNAKINIPDLRWFAQGGIFDRPSIIGVGEAGTEAVLPLERNTGWMDTLAAKIAAAIPGGPTGGDIYVYVGNEQVDAYVYRSQDRRNVKSNGR